MRKSDGADLAFSKNMRRTIHWRVLVTLSCTSSIALLAIVGGCAGDGSGSLGDSDASTLASDSATGNDSSPLASDAGVQVNDGAKYCVTVDPASFTKDAPCNKDLECSGIQTGEVCDGCLCSINLAVAVAEASKYSDAIRSVQRDLCNCSAGPQVRCIAHACSLCTSTPIDGGCNKI
jgi:hypothetical protein